MDPLVGTLVAQLASLVTKNTAAEISTRLNAIRANKDRGEQFTTLSETINELLEERSELVSIAQSFKQELTSQRITEKEIEYITQELIPKAEELFSLMSGSDEDESEERKKAQEAVEILKTLVSPEMLTVLQLVGFNFKAAIGEPLTDLLAATIRANVSKRESNNQAQLLAMKNEVLFKEIVLDEAAYNRWMVLAGNAQ
ncbi:hypothetical protein [Arthrobacter sp. H5]|uniref:hypothetical protein n=1 Tax=Arthrobacter sp. H5 TaxID=1267973 RepID=UPI000483FCF6|nr:hypothetical protein [Arthrobacter sp. H5]